MSFYKIGIIFMKVTTLYFSCDSARCKIFVQMPQLIYLRQISGYNYFANLAFYRRCPWPFADMITGNKNYVVGCCFFMIDVVPLFYLLKSFHLVVLTSPPLAFSLLPPSQGRIDCVERGPLLEIWSSRLSSMETSETLRCCTTSDFLHSLIFKNGLKREQCRN